MTYTRFRDHVMYRKGWYYESRTAGVSSKGMPVFVIIIIIIIITIIIINIITNIITIFINIIIIIITINIIIIIINIIIVIIIIINMLSYRYRLIWWFNFLSVIRELY